MAKRAEFRSVINNHHPDIIFGCETWLTPDISTAEFLPTEYSVFRRDRPDGYGGVLLAFQNTLNATEYSLSNTYNCEVIAATLTHGNEKIIVCSIYRPPLSDATYLQNLISILKDMSCANPTVPIWIGGDLNLPNIDWSTTSVMDNRYPLILCDLVLDFTADFGYLQMVQCPTRNSNILDIFLTNHPSLVESCEVIPGVSDHEIVLVKTLTKISHSKAKPRNITLWHKADFEAINNYIDQFAETFFSTYDHSTPVNTLWDEFKTLCISCIDMIPHKPSCTNAQPPWITRNIKRLSRKKQRKYNKARKSNSEADWAVYRDLKKEMQRICRSSHNNYISLFLD